MKWTDEQKRVIETRGKNLLVSAAAGSGKTAVLSERIISMLTDEKEPVSIDRLLVMTFTKAAAAEMRERISSKLREKIREDKGNRHLRMQAALLPRARIATIDSVCSNLIKQNYQSLDIDPTFRVADEGELKLLKRDIIREILEEKYGERDESFQLLEESISGGRSDEGLYELILRTYEFIRSYPFEESVFNKISKETEKENKNEAEGLPWMDFMLSYIREEVSEYERLLEAARGLCEDPSGPSPYLPAVEEALETAERLKKAEGYRELQNEVLSCEFSRLKAIRSGSCDEELKEAVKAVRNGFKDSVKAMASEFFSQDEGLLMENTGKAAAAVGALIELTRTFMERFSEAKTKRNIVDFSDLEHMALKLLWRLDGEGKPVPTELSDRMSGEISEILIDEYQDSNGVQEYLVQALGAERFGRPDIFCVGDVKQSIYRFRLAKPEIFMDKYNSWRDISAAKDTDDSAKIELNVNFRSKRGVICSVNELFSRIMSKALGGVEYDEAAALKPGALYPPEQEKLNERNGYFGKTELVLLSGDGNEANPDLREAEAFYIAKRIKGLMNLSDRERAYRVFDRKTQGLRPVEYRDIVILMRSPASGARELVNILEAEGIPAYAENTSGYFNAPEVEVMLSILEITDNPLQDIPLTAVLRSPIGNFSDEELACIRCGHLDSEESLKGDGSMYSSLVYAAEKGNEKARSFLDMLSYFRERAMFATVPDLIEEIYEKTGYRDCAGAMPMGELRRANLTMLEEKAESYQKTSYKGLYNFVRYIEELKKYDADYGEAPLWSEEDNIVRISSIHKSKGLEYPIVILAGLDRRFNRADSKERVVFDADLGIAMDYTDTEKRIRYPGLKKAVIKKKILCDSMGEELRVLYVAMTRAREKLIMTAAVPDAEKALLKKKPMMPGRKGEKLMRAELLKAGSYLDLILSGLRDNHECTSINIVPFSDLREEAEDEAAEKASCMSDYMNINPGEVSDRGFREELERNLSFIYGFSEASKLYPKRSVSEIKHEKAELDFDDKTLEESEYGLDENSGIYSQKDVLPSKGALRGSAYHRVFELLDFSGAAGTEDVKAQLEAMVSSGRLSREERAYVDEATVLSLINDETGSLMAKASMEGRLFRERHFMIGRPASELTEGAPNTETQLLQGIIDAYIENDEDIILIDYKTDRIMGPREEGAEELKRKYGVQLELYAKALEQLTKKKVTEKIIYSTELSRSIKL